jgi:hypothetical protein
MNRQKIGNSRHGCRRALSLMSEWPPEFRIQEGFRAPLGAALWCQKLLACASSCLQISAAAAESNLYCSGVFSVMGNG